MKKPVDLLQTHWKHDSFRPQQETIINRVLEGENVIVLLPTGGGKSICYQVPALLMDGICLVVSPLIALIKDQVQSLNNKGIKAIALTSKLNREETITAFDNLMYGNYKFLYLSPEKLQSSFIKDKIKQLHVSMIAIDEAHCISEWGHDFRPSYLKIRTLKELQPEALWMALTATATSNVLEDISKQLNLEKPLVFKSSFKRSSLSYQIKKTNAVYDDLIYRLKSKDEVCIVYTNSRKKTMNLSALLKNNGISSCHYHGGMTAREKDHNYNLWMSESCKVMVATNAFGMGIDKSNVRSVIHVNTPQSIENYIQEAGRAGRDGKMATAVLFTNEGELHEASNWFESNLPEVKDLNQVYHCLNQFYAIAIGDLPENEFDFSIQHFCETYQLRIAKTYNALKILEGQGIITLDEGMSKTATLQLLISSAEIFDFIDRSPGLGDMLQVLLRTYGGLWDYKSPINIVRLANKTGISEIELSNALTELHKLGIVDYKSSKQQTTITFHSIREDAYTMNSILPQAKKQLQQKREKHRSIIKFINNDFTCRSTQLLEYFGEKPTEKCGICDVCLNESRPTAPVHSISNEILALLKNRSYSSKEIVRMTGQKDTDVLNSLRLLLEKNKIRITSQNKYKLKNA